MSISPILLLMSSVVSFSGYVPPHAGSDGLRFSVVADRSADVPAAMKACGIDDFAAIGSGSASAAYKFAVTPAAAADAHCLLRRLPEGSRLTPLDHWTKDAQAD